MGVPWSLLKPEVPAGSRRSQWELCGPHWGWEVPKESGRAPRDLGGPHRPIATSHISAESLLPVRFFLPRQRQELPGAVSPPLPSQPSSGAQFPLDLNGKS